MSEITLLTQPLYDKLTVATSGTTELDFFQTPKGQGGKTDADTNLTTAGQVPGGQAYHVQGIRLIPDPMAAVADVQECLRNGHLELNVNGRTLFQTPLENTASGRGIVAALDGSASAVGVAANGLPHADNLTRLGNGIELGGGEQFNVSLKYKAAPTPTAAVDFTVVLESNLIRETN